MKRNGNTLRLPSIHIQAVMAVLLINFTHKLVREIPGSLRLIAEDGRIGILVTISTALILALAISLLCFKNRWGLFLGVIPGIWAMLQWIIVHVIKGHPDPNGIWWYPIFPIVQGALIIYFSIMAWRIEKSYSRTPALQLD